MKSCFNVVVEVVVIVAVVVPAASSTDPPSSDAGVLLVWAGGPEGDGLYSVDLATAGLERLRLPVVMKSTLKRMEGAKAVVVEKIKQGVSAYREQGEGEVILEEWIPGKDGDVYFCLQAYSENSEPLASFTGRKIRQWPPLIGGTASAEPADVPELEETTTP